MEKDENTSGDNVSEIDGLKKQIQELSLKLKLAEEQMESSSQTSLTSLDHLQEVLKKEFKITGQVGEPGQKDKLTYVSLCRQVETGLKKGYSDDDIVAAVIKALSPSLKLRSYLESQDNLTWVTVKKILRSHFREGNATDLYKELSGMSQKSGETTQSFAMRAMEARQKILLVSQECDEIVYDRIQVQKLFERTLQTGISSETIRTELKSLWQGKQSVKDEEILETINAATHLEEERSAKLSVSTASKSRSTVGVKSIARVENDDQVTSTNSKSNSKNLEMEITELKAQVAALHSNSGYGTRPKAQGTRSRISVCKQCQASGKETGCNHCFYCFSEEHFSRGCRQKKAGNAAGTLLRDRE